MKCPSCKEVVLSMSSRNGVEIDFCPTCRGVWLDRGELDKIIEKAQSEQESLLKSQIQAQEVNSRPQNYQQHQQPHYDSYKYKRKKSFLEDLFD